VLRVSDITFETHQDEDGVLWLSGELDMSSVDAFLARSTPALARVGGPVLDLSNLSFMDSTGIRAILTLADRCDPQALVLRRPTSSVRKLLDVTGIVGRRGITLSET
jgi:anti-sigma B factor antagonist